MLLSKHLSWLMVAWLFATASCTAEEPSFPLPTGEQDESSLENQYIIQFYERPTTSRGAFLDDDIEEIVREVPSRKIVVARFFSEKAAARWKSKAKGIKYFEKGKKKDDVKYLADHPCSNHLNDDDSHQYRHHGIPIR